VNESGAVRSQLYVRQCVIDSETQLDCSDMFGYVADKEFGIY